MVKVLLFTILLLLLTGINRVNSQVLAIGQKCPDIELSGLINHPIPNCKISDFKGKLVLIDFWNQACIPCIQAFPKLDSLQKQFKDDIQIVLVNKESKDSTDKFFRKHKMIKMPNLLMVTGDKDLIRLFPAEGYPYSVWLDSNAVVIHYSAVHSISENNIRMYLTGSALKIRNPTIVKKASYEEINNTEYYSKIFHCNDSIDNGSSEIEFIRNNTMVRMSSTCLSIVELYKKAYREYGKYNFNTRYNLIIKVRDSAKYLFPNNPDNIDYWFKNNSFSYDLILPISKKNIRYKIMQQDLERYFDVKASLLQMDTKSLILVRKQGSNKLKTKGGNPIEKFMLSSLEESSTDSNFHLINQPFETFYWILKSRIEYFFPFSNQTGYVGNIDISIPVRALYPLNIPILKKELNKYGLDLIYKLKKTPVLVLEEKDNQ
jgi:thiol-disulfide isomerase/thioredoxin